MSDSPTLADSPLSITASIAGLLTFVFALLSVVYLRLPAVPRPHDEYFRVKTSVSWFKTESEWINDLVASQRDVARERRGGMDLGADAAKARAMDEDGLWEKGDMGMGTGMGIGMGAGMGMGGKSGSGFVPPQSWGSGGGGADRTDDRAKEREMYLFVLDQLGKLEERLLSILEIVEEEATKAEERSRRRDSGFSGYGYANWTVVPRSWRVSTGIAVAWLPVRTKALELVRQREALGGRVAFAQLAMIGS
jgi:hypothetical protein